MVSSTIGNGFKEAQTLAHRRFSCYTSVHEDRCSWKEGRCTQTALTSPSPTMYVCLMTPRPTPCGYSMPAERWSIRHSPSSGPTSMSLAVIVLALLGRSEEHTSELQSPDHLVC